MLFIEAEWKARDGNFGCMHSFVQASEKLPTHLDWALPWQQGFFCLKGGFFLLYELHPDDFGLCVKLQDGRCKGQDCKV